MKAAVVVEAGHAPVYGDFRDPVPEVGKSIIHVTASSISHLTKSRASGTHYSSSDALPFVPGIDGVGRDGTGRRVYFVMPEIPFGGMGELCLVDERRLIPLPDALDDATAAAMAIPGMSSWAALIERAHLVRGETVLVNGATGTSGRLAIQIAKHLGARKVIATGRNTQSFGELRQLGADVTIQLTQDTESLAAAFSNEFRQGVDVVLDYIWGPSAEMLITAAATESREGTPIRYIEIGSASGASVALPGAALRSSALQLLGSGMGSIPMPNLMRTIQNVLNAAVPSDFRVSTHPMQLSEVKEAWANESDARIVLRP